eukprot:7391430-Prorocentrum_lima.AAC.1
MTSSLVGSEMCIRDSSMGGRRPAFQSKRAPLCISGDVHNATRPALAVSYTHLTLPTICSV